MATNSEPPKYEDIVQPLEQVADIIPVLNGNLATYAKRLEDLAKVINEESSACDRPTIGFKINDLLSLVNAVSLKLRSYKRCCLDVAIFGAHYEDKELQSLNGMLSFIQEMSSFSSLLDKRVDAIISETEKAMEAVLELLNINFKSSNKTTQFPQQVPSSEPNDPTTQPKDQQPEGLSSPTTTPAKEPGKQSQEQPPNVSGDGIAQISWIGFATGMIRGCTGAARNFFTQLNSKDDSQTATMLKECEKELNELAAEAQRLKSEVIAAYSKNVIQGLKKWTDAQEIGELCETITKIKVQCNKLQVAM